MFGIIRYVAVGFECVLCSLNLSKKLISICPIYTLLQSWHVNLYALDHEYLSVAQCFGISNFVRSEILRSVFFNRFVMNVVSLPMYVKEAHFCVAAPVCPSEVVGGLCVCGLGNCCLT